VRAVILLKYWRARPYVKEKIGGILPVGKVIFYLTRLLDSLSVHNRLCTEDPQEVIVGPRLNSHRTGVSAGSYRRWSLRPSSGAGQSGVPIVGPLRSTWVPQGGSQDQRAYRKELRGNRVDGLECVSYELPKIQASPWNL
jgi:hypothetical protein